MVARYRATEEMVWKCESSQNMPAPTALHPCTWPTRPWHACILTLPAHFLVSHSYSLEMAQGDSYDENHC